MWCRFAPYSVPALARVDTAPAHGHSGVQPCMYTLLLGEGSMAGPRRIEWRRRSPQRALSNLGWYGVIAVLVVACIWLLFGNEPRTLDGGGDNPLALLPTLVTALGMAGAAVMVVPVLRRPVVAANHYALLVRPGAGRTLALPWVGIAEIAVAVSGHRRYLLVRRHRGMDLRGAQPGWLDQAVLRRLQRGAPDARWAEYDLAVPMDVFVGGVQAQLSGLAAYAPDTVAFVAGTVQ